MLAQFHGGAAAQGIGVGRVNETQHGDLFAFQMVQLRVQPAERPAAVQVVALFDGRDDGNLFAFRIGNFRERDHVASERATGEWPAGT